VFDKRFKNDIEVCFAVVAKMFFSGRIGQDGSIDVNNMVNTRKYELWSYIYYLYYYNNTSIEEFAAMKSKQGTASADKFYSTVRTVVDNKFVNTSEDVKYPSFDVQTLAYFINLIVHKYEGEIKNPITDFIRELLASKDPVGKLNSLILKTNAGNIKLPADNARINISRI